jgi:DNA-binding NtrC family response regulator
VIRYTLYIIDDEESITQSVSLGLKKHYKVKAFSAAEAAISALNSDPPDLVLLDIGLPGMSGIEALKKIKDFNPDILVIMVTAYEEFDTVISAMKLGAHDYIIKPIHMDSLPREIP